MASLGRAVRVVGLNVEYFEVYEEESVMPIMTRTCASCWNALRLLLKVDFFAGKERGSSVLVDRFWARPP